MRFSEVKIGDVFPTTDGYAKILELKNDLY